MTHYEITARVRVKEKWQPRPIHRRIVIPVAPGLAALLIIKSRLPLPAVFRLSPYALRALVRCHKHAIGSAKITTWVSRESW